ncbi:PqiC family protein [Desulfogranum japonicum]|uniref:PqiC family protein n=1 Tax=Desulfogranum japonicum TaxID=231447 RepID=UPI00048DE5E8|nr:PqiC family protein [Desulfogranum japonicum]
MRTPILLLSLCCSLFLGGCVGSTTKMHQYALYPLDVNGQEKLPGKEPLVPAMILIMPVELAALLQHPGILSRPDGTTVTIARTHAWAAPLDQQLTTVLSQNLGALLHSPNIAVYPGPRYAKYDYRIEVNIQDFSMTNNTFNTLANWTISNSKTQRVVKRSSFALSTELAIPDYPHQVTAGSQAISTLSGQIADTLIGLQQSHTEDD